MFNKITKQISEEKLQLAGRKLARFINKSFEDARVKKDYPAIQFWMSMRSMHKMNPVMKTWNLKQLVARFHETNGEHEIEYVFDTC